jgi:hypothetical protein
LQPQPAPWLYSVSLIAEEEAVVEDIEKDLKFKGIEKINY